MDRTIVTPQGVDVSDSGKSLRIFFMYKNTRCRETLNIPPTKTNIKHAANLRAEILSKIARDDFNYKEYFPESRLAKKLTVVVKEVKHTKFSKLLDQQMEIYAKKVTNNRMSPSTFDGYKKIITGHLMPAFGKYNINDITPLIIRKWITSLKVTPKTTTNCLIPLKHVFDDALNDGLIEENPLSKIAIRKLIDKTATPSEYYAEPFDELEKQTIINSTSGQLRNLIQFGFWSGLRTSELIALKWGDIDFKRGVANISRAKVCHVEKGTKTKSGTRTLILLPKAREALINQLSYTKDSEYVFHNPNTNTAWSSSGKVSDTWRKLLSGIDIKYRNCYQMRHTYASTLLSNGENPLWVSTQMGHVDVEMISKKYGRWIPKSEDNGYKFVGSY